MTGRLDLIGVGPGDPELLTLKAVRRIAAADLVAYPRTESGAALAFEIARPHIAEPDRALPLDIPMRGARAAVMAAYDGIADTLATHVGAGRNVAYLCEGDPMLYGSAAHLLDRLAGRVPVQIVPGVTSLTAAAAAASLPLGTGADILKILPASLPDAALEAELATAGAAAFIKPGRHTARLRELLARTGRAEAAIVVSYATQDRQVIAPLTEITGDLPYFSIVLVPGGSGIEE